MASQWMAGPEVYKHATLWYTKQVTDARKFHLLANGTAIAWNFTYNICAGSAQQPVLYSYNV